MRNFLLIALLVLLSQPAWCQPPQGEHMPPRTAEEEAMKQTERLTRELAISDTVTRDTLYRLHLKYAVLRRKGLTRAQNLQYMQQATEELSHILSEEQFNRLPHPDERPQQSDTTAQPIPISEATDTPYTPEMPEPHQP